MPDQRAAGITGPAVGRVRKDLLRARGLSGAAWDREAHGYTLSR